MYWTVETVVTGETLKDELQRLSDEGWTIFAVLTSGGRAAPEYNIVANMKDKDKAKKRQTRKQKRQAEEEAEELAKKQEREAAKKREAGRATAGQTTGTAT